MILRKLRIPAALLAQAPSTEGHKNHGLDCYIAHSEALERLLYRHFARHGLCLKVFRELTKGERDGELSSVTWGGARLSVATQVQNLFALHGIAPRVYSLAIINGKYAAQVTDYAEGEGEPNYAEAKRVIKKYRLGIKGKPKEDATKAAIRYTRYPFKWVGSQFVDFGRYYFRDPKWYRRYLKNRVKVRKAGTVAYQAVPELGIPGQRNHKHRMKHMRLDDIDFRGKTALDLGCNNGAMLREALRRGAKRVVGVDFRRVSYWFQIMNLLEYWNFDMLPLDLPEQVGLIEICTGIAKFDVVFALAIVQHMEGGYQPWIADLTKSILVLEGNWNKPASKYRPLLNADFTHVAQIGVIRDDDERALLRCRKGLAPKPKALPKTEPYRRKAAIKRGRTIEGRVMLPAKSLGFLYDVAKQAPDGAAVEIGVMHGSSLIAWTPARAGQPCYAVEIKRWPELVANLERLELLGEVQVLWETSASAAPLLPDLAFCFIDGDHSHKGIARDLKAYARKIVPGGVLVFHDYDKDEDRRGKGYGVYRAVDAWRKKSGWACLGREGRCAAFRRPG